MSAQFDGSKEQTRILQLRQLEGKLRRIKSNAALLVCRTLEDTAAEIYDAVEILSEDATEALELLDHVER